MNQAKVLIRTILLLALALALAPALSGCLPGKPLEKIPPQLTAGNQEILEGLEWYDRGCYQKALDHYFKANERFTAVDQIRGKAMAENNIGNCLRLLGDPESAALFLEESVDLYTGMDDPRGEIQARVNLAAALADAARLPEALAALDRAAELVPATGSDYWPLANTRGVVLWKLGRTEEARQALEKALSAPAWPGGSRAAAFHSMGILLLETGQPREAAGHFLQALDMDREKGFFPGIADDLWGAARAEKAAGNLKEAARYFRRASQVWGVLGMDEPARRALAELTALAEETGTDPSLTLFFLDRWEEGLIRANPCD
ncbi:MAG: tetratricopeptide repeat protein [Proteobacteria bacterium]|nr:tetratricopeptide repeat protein [Pseudomonadota bacterium]